MDKSHIQEIPINAAVITVSTTRTEKEDKSGAEIKAIFKAAGIPVDYYAIIPDNESRIRAACLEALEKTNCVVINGGTGITHDDCTIEAITPLLQKKMDGFGEIFRLKSLDDIGTAALLSRAVAGIIDRKAVFCIPGSTGAVKLAMNEIIIKELRHIITHASK